MCTKYDKNKNYTVREIATLIYSEHKEHWTSFQSAIGSINVYINQQGFAPVNGQKSHRVFPGKIAQTIYDHYNNTLRTSNRQIAVEEIFSEVSVTFKSAEGRELDRRSKLLGIPKVKILEDILHQYFKEHPCDEYDAMSAEELRKELRRRDVEQSNTED